MRIPLFPLHTIILPGGQLSLRIFEPRYLDMLSDCLRNAGGFGVCQILAGKEAAGVAVPYPNGTLVRIADWNQGDDGLLNVLVEGQQKFHVQSTSVMPNDLLTGEVQLLAQEEHYPLPAKYRVLAKLLKHIFAQLKWNTDLSRPRFDDSLWVGSRLLELLPLPKQQRQKLFECSDPLSRLDGVSWCIHNAVVTKN